MELYLAKHTAPISQHGVGVIPMFCVLNQQMPKLSEVEGIEPRVDVLFLREIFVHNSLSLREILTEICCALNC